MMKLNVLILCVFVSSVFTTGYVFEVDAYRKRYVARSYARPAASRISDVKRNLAHQSSFTLARRQVTGRMSVPGIAGGPQAPNGQTTVLSKTQPGLAAPRQLSSESVNPIVRVTPTDQKGSNTIHSGITKHSLVAPLPRQPPISASAGRSVDGQVKALGMSSGRDSRVPKGLGPNFTGLKQRPKAPIANASGLSVAGKAPPSKTRARGPVKQLCRRMFGGGQECTPEELDNRNEKAAARYTKIGNGLVYGGVMLGGGGLGVKVGYPDPPATIQNNQCVPGPPGAGQKWGNGLSWCGGGMVIVGTALAAHGGQLAGKVNANRLARLKAENGNQQRTTVGAVQAPLDAHFDNRFAQQNAHVADELERHDGTVNDKLQIHDNEVKDKLEKQDNSIKRITTAQQNNVELQLTAQSNAAGNLLAKQETRFNNALDQHTNTVKNQLNGQSKTVQNKLDGHRDDVSAALGAHDASIKAQLKAQDDAVQNQLQAQNDAVTNRLQAHALSRTPSFTSEDESS